MLARVGTAAMVAHPQTHQMAPAVGLRMVHESGAAVAQSPVVDKLDLTRFEVEIDREAVLFENIEGCGERSLAVAVDRLAPQRISAVDLMDAEAGLRFAVLLEYRRSKDRALAGPEFALPVEPEWLIKPLQPVRVALLQHIVDGMKADDAAVPAALRLTQTE